jgi:putative peptidoglycan lipid II flippase
MGLWAFASERILVSTFFAMQDTRTPVTIAAVSVAFNLAAGVALMGPMGHGGIALAVTLASSLSLLLLVGALRRKLGRLAWGAVGASVAKSMAAAALMGLAISRVAPAWTAPVGGTTLGLLAGVLSTVALGAALYGLAACLLKSPEVASLLAFARKGRKTA